MPPPAPPAPVAETRTVAPSRRRHLRRGWSVQRIVLGLLLAGLALLACSRAWADIFWIAWRDDEASQIWLTPFVAAWLVWIRWDALRRTRPRYSLVGPALVAAGIVTNILGFAGNVELAWHAGAVLALVGAVATVVGSRILVRALPAVAVLVFLVPVPSSIRQQIALPLQQGVAYASEIVFDLMTLDVRREGNLLTYNGQTAMIAEACNGMRMMFALLLVAYAFAFGTPLIPQVRVALIVIAPFVAILCNIIRVVPTVIVIGHYPDAVGTLFHDLSAWVMLGIAFAILLGLVRLLDWAEVPVMQRQVALATA